MGIISVTHPCNRECAQVNHAQKWVSIVLQPFSCLSLLIKRHKVGSVGRWAFSSFSVSCCMA